MNSTRIDSGRGREFASAVLYLMCRCGSEFVFKIQLHSDRTYAQWQKYVCKRQAEQGSACIFFECVWTLVYVLCVPSCQLWLKESYSLHPDSCSLNTEE